jgi:molecular chaperone DnaK (HSP70)
MRNSAFASVDAEAEVQLVADEAGHHTVPTAVGFAEDGVISVGQSAWD